MFNSEELPTDNTEKKSGLEGIREKFKTRFLIVDDGYDWDSVTLPEDLPTVFHGTSAWLQENIEKNGLINSVDSMANIEKVFNLHPDLRKLYQYTVWQGSDMGKRMKPDEYKSRKKVYCTYNHYHAGKYTRGPEILNDYLEAIKERYESWHGYDNSFEPYLDKVINELGAIDTREKKLLMSCLKPKPLIVHVKPTRKEFDFEATSAYSGVDFLENTQSKEGLCKEIRWARERYLLHSKGKPVSLSETSRMWIYIQGAATLTNPTDFETLPIVDLLQIYLRDNYRHLLLNNINPQSITKLEKM